MEYSVSAVVPLGVCIFECRSAFDCLEDCFFISLFVAYDIKMKCMIQCNNAPSLIVMTVESSDPIKFQEVVGQLRIYCLLLEEFEIHLSIDCER